MPKSLRDNAKVSPEYRARIKALCMGRKLPSHTAFRVVMTFYAHWLTSQKTIRRRDHLNYAATLCDILCAELGVDDSSFWHIELLKQHSEQADENVRVNVYATSAQA